MSANATAWPNEEDRQSWEAHRLTSAGACLPPYDEAGEELQRLWHHMQRLTMADIGDACQSIIQRMDAEEP